MSDPTSIQTQKIKCIKCGSEDAVAPGKSMVTGEPLPNRCPACGHTWKSDTLDNYDPPIRRQKAHFSAARVTLVVVTVVIVAALIYFGREYSALNSRKRDADEVQSMVQAFRNPVQEAVGVVNRPKTEATYRVRDGEVVGRAIEDEPKMERLLLAVDVLKLETQLINSDPDKRPASVKLGDFNSTLKEMLTREQFSKVEVIGSGPPEPVWLMQIKKRVNLKDYNSTLKEILTPDQFSRLEKFRKKYDYAHFVTPQ